MSFHSPLYLVLLFVVSFAFYNRFKKSKKYEIIPLIDNSANIRSPEQANLDAKNWYGGLVYDIIYIKKSGRKYYTLLSYDLNNNFSKKRLIIVRYFSE